MSKKFRITALKDWEGKVSCFQIQEVIGKEVYTIPFNYDRETLAELAAVIGRYLGQLRLLNE